MSAARTATAPPRDARPYAPRPSTTIAAHCAPAAASRAAARLCEPRTIPDILARGALDTLNRNVTLSGRDKLSDLARKQSFSTAFSHTCSSAKCLEKWYTIRKAVVLAVNFFDSFFFFRLVRAMTKSVTWPTLSSTRTRLAEQRAFGPDCPLRSNCLLGRT